MSRKRDVYTLKPLTREQWAELDQANRYRAAVRCADGRMMHGMYRPDEATAKADLDELVSGYEDMRGRCPYLSPVEASDIEDRGEGVDLPELILQRLAELGANSGEQ